MISKITNIRENRDWKWCKKNEDNCENLFYLPQDDKCYEIDNDVCDCNGNVEDCAGVCGGSSIIDQCGVCGSDNSSCSDCLGSPNGDAVYYNCGTCDSDSENDCTQDCAGNW